MKNIQLDIIVVKGKLDMEVDSIDDVIMLLDYIASLRYQDTKIGDIVVQITTLTNRMEYIEANRVKFPDAQYVEYLNTRLWPKAFKEYIKQRNRQLLQQKDALYIQMSREIEGIKVKIKAFK
jgi:hypothetical protein